MVFEDSGLSYAPANGTVLSTWPVGGGAKAVPVSPVLNSSHAVELLTTATNIITLRSKLNWIGEASTLLGIVSGVWRSGRFSGFEMLTALRLRQHLFTCC